VIDVAGRCCNGTLAADGRCCTGGSRYIDDCGVCDGANACPLRVDITLGIAASDKDFLLGSSPQSSLHYSWMLNVTASLARIFQVQPNHVNITALNAVSNTVTLTVSNRTSSWSRVLQNSTGSLRSVLATQPLTTLHTVHDATFQKLPSQCPNALHRVQVDSRKFCNVFISFCVLRSLGLQCVAMACVRTAKHAEMPCAVTSDPAQSIAPVPSSCAQSPPSTILPVEVTVEACADCPLGSVIVLRGTPAQGSHVFSFVRNDYNT
jgi:hypothetical protein